MEKINNCVIIQSHWNKREVFIVKNDFKTVALLTAAGTGTRMNMEVPKQFYTVMDKPIIIYTLEAFEIIQVLMK